MLSLASGVLTRFIFDGNPPTPVSRVAGFPTPLRFFTSLALSVNANEDDVVQILANVIHGS